MPGEEIEPVPGVDPATGEVVDPEALKRSLSATPPEVPGQQGLASLRRNRTSLSTPMEVDQALQNEIRRLELANERMAEVRKLLHGWYTAEGDYVAGAEFEHAEIYDQQVRELYWKCNDPDVDKADRPKWPGEDVRNSLVNEHIDVRHREALSAYRGELKTLETYIGVVKQRLTGLVTLMAYHKEEMKMAGYTPPSGQEGQ